MLPVLEVSRLSSASSFYSAISQPLGIRYLSPLPTPPDSPSKAGPSSYTALIIAQPTLTFGSADSSRQPVFQIRQVTPTQDRPLKKSHLVLSADSLDAVNDFHAAALRAYPRSAAVIGTRASLDTNIPDSSDSPASLSLDDVCARVTDYDGNIMEVDYLPYSSSYGYHQPHQSYYGGGGSSSSRHHHRSDYDSDRVLHYSPASAYASRYHNGDTSGGSPPRYREMPTSSSYDHHYYDVASPRTSSSRYHGGSNGGGGGTGSNRMGLLRRSTTSASAASYESGSSPSSTKSGGMSTAGMFGLAAAGAVAGAAFTYSVLQNGSRSSSRRRSSRDPHGELHEYEEAATAVPSFQRHATFPESYETYKGYSGSRYGGGVSGAGASSRDGGGMRSRSRSIAAQKEVEDVYDYDGGAGRAHSTSRYRSGSVGGGSARARSEAPSYDRVPLMLPEMSSRNSYVSAARTERTERGSGGAGGSSSRLASVPPNSSRSAPLRHYASASQATGSRSGGSRHSRSSSRGVDSHATLTRAATMDGRSYMSARNVPLPMSGVGSSHAPWEGHHDDRYDMADNRFANDENYLYDDGDNDSVAPSDSISCVGSRGRYH